MVIYQIIFKGFPSQKKVHCLTVSIPGVVRVMEFPERGEETLREPRRVTGHNKNKNPTILLV